MGDGGHIDVKEGGSSTSTITPVTALALWARGGALGTATRNLVGVADPVHLTGGEPSSLATAEALRSQALCNLLVREDRGQLPYASDDCGSRPPDLTQRLGPGDFQRATGRGLPANINPDRDLAFGEGDIFNQQPHELFAFRSGGGGRVPDQRQVLRERKNARAFRIIHRK